VLEREPPEAFAIDVDAILLQGAWSRWLSLQQSNPQKRAAAARAWCASSYWNSHTPALEDWKTTVVDLASDGLSRTSLAEMANSDRNLTFPAIPLFENEQVRDLCGLLSDTDSALIFSVGLASGPDLLTFKAKEAPEACWHLLNPAVRGDLDYAAWSWLLAASGVSNESTWPSRQSLRALWNFEHAKRARAIELLEQAARQSQDPAAALVLLEISALRGTPDDDESPELLSASYESIAESLFDSTAHHSQWKVVESAIVARKSISAEPHPLSVMVKHLRMSDIPAEQDERAWSKLQAILTRFSTLLEVDTADPTQPLPALELAACVRSTMPVGEVAVALIRVAGVHRRNAHWWAALRTGLERCIRRSGWALANDRTSLAIAAVRSQARWLSEMEALALDDGFKLETNPYAQ
jgi:hypothetical protein